MQTDQSSISVRYVYPRIMQHNRNQREAYAQFFEALERELNIEMANAEMNVESPMNLTTTTKDN